MPWGQIAAAAIGAGVQAFGASQANAESGKSVDKQMDFQERMYHNRYFYQMQDMRRAGLNPILAYKSPPPGGPAGASYTAQNEYGHVADSVSRGVSSAIDSRRQAVEQARVDELLNQIRAQTRVLNAEQHVKNASARNIEADTLLKNVTMTMQNAAAQVSNARIPQINEEMLLTKLKQDLERHNITMARRGATAADIDAEMLNTTFGKILRWLDMTGRAIHPLADVGQSGVRNLRKPSGAPVKKTETQKETRRWAPFDRLNWKFWKKGK